MKMHILPANYPNVIPRTKRKWKKTKKELMKIRRTQLEESLRAKRTQDENAPFSEDWPNVIKKVLKAMFYQTN